MSDVASLLSAIDADANALDQASKELRRLADELVDAEVSYEDAMDVALTTVEEQYRSREEKLPSERQREAHARPLIDPDVRHRYMRVSRRLKVIKDWAEIRGRALSARQSELNALKAEAGVPVQQPSWSGRRAA